MNIDPVIWTEFQQLVALFMPYLTGAVVVFLVNKIKEYGRLYDRQVLYLTIVVSILAGILSLVAENTINPDTLTITNFAETVLAIFVAATAWYFKISRPRAEKKAYRPVGK